MLGGFAAYLIVCVPLGGLLAAWGVVSRRSHPKAGTFMVAWGAGGPFFAPAVTGLTWLALGDAAPESPHEPWSYTAAAWLYSVAFSSAATVAAIFAGLTTFLGDIGIPREERHD